MPAERLDLPRVGPELIDANNPFARRAETAEDPGPFRIGELSRRSGVAVGTIKYYLREGLVRPGEATAKTQALYDGEHLRRLRLIRVLADVGGLSIAEIRGVTSALDDDGTHEPGEIERLAGYSLGSTPVGNGTEDAAGADQDDTQPAADLDTDEVAIALGEARAATDAFIDGLGFEVDAHSPARAELAEALHALRVLGFADDPIVFYEHARLAYELGSFEIEYAGASGAEPTTAVEAITVGSVIFGSAFMALRRLSHEHETRRQLGR